MKREYLKGYHIAFEGNDYVCYTLPRFSEMGNKFSSKLIIRVFCELRINKHLPFSYIETRIKGIKEKDNRKTILNVIANEEVIELFGRLDNNFPIIYFSKKIKLA